VRWAGVIQLSGTYGSSILCRNLALWGRFTLNWLSDVMKP
jgi:hypothetical protein